MFIFFLIGTVSCAEILRSGLNPEDGSKAENFNPKAQIFTSASNDLSYLFTRNMHRSDSVVLVTRTAVHGSVPHLQYRSLLLQ